MVVHRNMEDLFSTITFYQKDMDGVYAPHYDPIVNSIHIYGYMS